MARCPSDACAAARRQKARPPSTTPPERAGAGQGGTPSRPGREGSARSGRSPSSPCGNSRQRPRQRTTGVHVPDLPEARAADDQPRPHRLHVAALASPMSSTSSLAPAPPAEPKPAAAAGGAGGVSAPGRQPLHRLFAGTSSTRAEGGQKAARAPLGGRRVDAGIDRLAAAMVEFGAATLTAGGEPAHEPREAGEPDDDEHQPEQQRHVTISVNGSAVNKAPVLRGLSDSARAVRSSRHRAGTRFYLPPLEADESFVIVFAATSRSTARLWCRRYQRS